jgi:radical SAM superfamily enzyme with C-terminal helix-hairpin-helix motif
MRPQVVIFDCYTDEPSGYGVRPYLGTHQIHLSQALSHLGVDHVYLTIDDLRYANGLRSNGADEIL